MALKSAWQSGGISRFTIIVLVLFTLAMVPTLRGISEENDFNIFFSAAQSLRDGESMYDGPHLYGMWYYYSPLFAALLVPFTFTHLIVLKLAWLAVSLFMLFRILKLISAFFNIPDTTNGRWFVALLALTALHATFLNLLHGQMTILVLWCSMEGTWQFMHSKYARGGFSFAAGINVKLLPVFFFFSYLVKRNFKALVWMGIGVVSLAAIPYLFLSFGFHNELLAGWIDMINPLNAEHVNTTGEGGFIDFASLITKYCTAAAISSEAQLNFTNLTEYEVFLLQNLYRLVALVIVGFMILRVHSKLSDNNLRQFADMAVVLLLIPAAFPHQRDYSILMCWPAFTMLIYSMFLTDFKPPLWLLVFTAIAIGLTGSLMYLELFGHRMRVFIYETRLNGIGLQVFIPLYIFWMYQFASRQKQVSETT